MSLCVELLLVGSSNPMLRCVCEVEPGCRLQDSYDGFDCDRCWLVRGDARGRSSGCRLGRELPVARWGWSGLGACQRAGEKNVPNRWGHVVWGRSGFEAVQREPDRLMRLTTSVRRDRHREVVSDSHPQAASKMKGE
ncbi:MAG: hypothetical protein FWD57_06350 [Polyangiaceae bacterium]|nr:hypothetical protein [Polyangiaceae bacterium]